MTKRVGSYMLSTMKKSLVMALAVFLLGATMAIPRAWADVSNTATVDLAEVGEGQVSIALTTDVPGVTTMSLALDINVSSEMGNYVTAVYQPSQKVIDATPSADNRYYTTKVDGDVIRMNIYIVNATDLIENNQLDMGIVDIALAEGAPNDSVTATFSIPQGAEPIRMVSGYDDEIRIPDANIYVPDEPSITLGTEKAPIQEKGDKTTQATDVVGDTEDTRVGADTVPIAGDTLMPIIIGLIVVIVVVIVVLIVVATRRKSSNSADADQGDSSNNMNNG